MLVPAPGLFMTTTVRPRALPKDSPTVRATASEPPPAAKPTTHSTGLPVWACAVPMPSRGGAPMASAALSACLRSILSPSCSGSFCLERVQRGATAPAFPDRLTSACSVRVTGTAMPRRSATCSTAPWMAPVSVARPASRSCSIEGWWPRWWSSASRTAAPTRSALAATPWAWATDSTSSSTRCSRASPCGLASPSTVWRVTAHTPLKAALKASFSQMASCTCGSMLQCMPARLRSSASRSKTALRWPSQGMKRIPPCPMELTSPGDITRAGQVVTPKAMRSSGTISRNTSAWPMPFCRLRKCVSGPMRWAMPCSAARVWADLVKTSHSAGPAVSCSARAARTRACSSPSSVWQRAPSRFRACSSSSFTSTRVTSRPMRASRAPNRVPMAPAPRMPMLLVFSIAVSPAGGFASGDLDLDHDGLGMGQRALQHIGQLGRVLHMHAVAALATGQRHEVDVGQFRALDLLALAVAEDMGEVLQRRVAAVLEDHEADGQAQLGCAPEGLDGIHGRAIADDGDHLGLGLCQRHAHGGRHAVAQAAAAHGVEGARVEDGQVGLDGGARAGRLFHHDAVAVAHLGRSEEDPSVLPSPCYLVCRLLF